MARSNKNPFNFAFFKGPKFSVFDNSHGNRLSMKFGEMVPIYWDYLNPNERIEDSVSHLIRLQPMLFPVMDQIDIDMYAFAVPLDAIGAAYKNPYIYRDFFNLNKNIGGYFSLPVTNQADNADSSDNELVYLIKNMSQVGLKGTLYDYMGLPTLPNLRKAFRMALNDAGLFSLYPSSPSGFDIGDDDTVTVYGAGSMIDIHSALYGSNVDMNKDFLLQYAGEYVSFPAFWYWCLFKYPIGFRITNVFDVNVSSSSPVEYPFEVDRFVSPPDEIPLSPYVSYTVVNSVPRYSSGISSPISIYVDGLSGEQLLGRLLSIFSSEPIIGVSGDNSVYRDFYSLIYEHYKVSVSDLYDEYFNDMFYLFLRFGHVSDGTRLDPVLGNSSVYYAGYLNGSVSFGDMSTPEVGNFPLNDNANDRLGSIPYYPFDCYWKIISDWFLNTTFDDPEDWYLSMITDSSGVNAFSPWERGDATVRRLMGKPFNRNWRNDYFTSAFPSPQVGDAVVISDGDSIVDLRNKNSWQKLKEKLLYAGKRWRDVWYALTGIKSNLHESDMSIPLCEYHGHVNISSVLQTSQSNESSPQASYAGTGLSADGYSMKFNYTADQPTVIMVLASIRPKATYYQGIHKKLLRNNIYEYDWSDFANIGEQPIYNYEIFADAPSDSANSKSAVDIFGWTRRYADFMFTPNEVHGDMIDEYDAWHLARQFDTVPSLGQNFVSVNAQQDNLNRIFADTSTSDKFICHFIFDGAVVRSIPKFVKYDL